MDSTSDASPPNFWNSCLWNEESALGEMGSLSPTVLWLLTTSVSYKRCSSCRKVDTRCVLKSGDNLACIKESHRTAYFYFEKPASNPKRWFKGITARAANITNYKRTSKMSSTTGHIPQHVPIKDTTLSADYIDTSCGNAGCGYAGATTTSFTTTHNVGTME